jgi:hypothetical protein
MLGSLNRLSRLPLRRIPPPRRPLSTATSLFPSHSRKLWQAGFAIFFLGSALKYVSYELVRSEITSRGKRDDAECRRVLDQAKEPVDGRMGGLRKLTGEEGERLRRMLDERRELDKVKNVKGKRAGVDKAAAGGGKEGECCGAA